MKINFLINALRGGLFLPVAGMNTVNGADQVSEKLPMTHNHLIARGILLTIIITGLLLSGCSGQPEKKAGESTVQSQDQRYIDFDKETPSGTLEIEGKQVALIVGGGWGKGVLRFKGKDYPFKITGLKLGGVGYVSLDAVGNVYFLNKLEDFSGKYTAGAIGATPVKGSVWANVENTKGVILRLKAKSKGVALNLGAGGMSIKFE